MQKKKLVIVFIVVLLLAIIAGFVFFKYKKAPTNNLISDSTRQTNVTTQSNQPTQTNTPIKDAKHRLDNLNEQFKTTQFIPTNEEMYDMENNGINFVSKKDDCVGLLNGDTSGGDLLASLIGDKETQKWVKLNIYNSDYLSSLKAVTDEYSQTKYKKDLFAFYVCHITDKIDVVAGSVWDKTRSPYNVGEDGFITVTPDFSENQIVLLANNGKIYELKSVNAMSATATGGETSPCEQTLNGQIIEWKCFAGLGEDEKTQTTFATFKNWQISLDGKILKTWNTEDR